MARITSDSGPLRSAQHKPALITSDCPTHPTGRPAQPSTCTAEHRPPSPGSSARSSRRTVRRCTALRGKSMARITSDSGPLSLPSLSNVTAAAAAAAAARWARLQAPPTHSPPPVAVRPDVHRGADPWRRPPVAPQPTGNTSSFLALLLSFYPRLMRLVAVLQRGSCRHTPYTPCHANTFSALEPQRCSSHGMSRSDVQLTRYAARRSRLCRSRRVSGSTHGGVSTTSSRSRLCRSAISCTALRGKSMARITSDYGPLRSAQHKPALITSDCPRPVHCPLRLARECVDLTHHSQRRQSLAERQQQRKEGSAPPRSEMISIPACVVTLSPRGRWRCLCLDRSSSRTSSRRAGSGPTTAFCRGAAVAITAFHHLSPPFVAVLLFRLPQGAAEDWRGGRVTGDRTGAAHAVRNSASARGGG